MENTPLVRKAIHLSWFTIGYNLLEGLVSISYGVSDESIALAGFGADSLIEVGSAFLVLWRFRGESGEVRVLPVERERRATLGIGMLFLLLAFSAASAAAIQLVQMNRPDTTLPGLIISALSLSFMFFLWRAKVKVGSELGSSAVLADAACSLACIKLSVVLFLGSLLWLAAPALWWADSVAAILIAALVAREGWETIQHAREPDFSGGCCG